MPDVYVENLFLKINNRLLLSNPNAVMKFTPQTSESDTMQGITCPVKS